MWLIIIGYIKIFTVVFLIFFFFVFFCSLSRFEM
uniref:Uncharacterized protein n=1 Tax=Anguilla anguilla TaxID=7936 RepID=A0A0E9QND7_ANGAN